MHSTCEIHAVCRFALWTVSLWSFAENLAPLVTCWLGSVTRTTHSLWRRHEPGRFLSTHFCWSRSTWSRGLLLTWRAEVSFRRRSVPSLLSLAKPITPQPLISKTACDLETNLPLLPNGSRCFSEESQLKRKYDKYICEPAKFYQLYMSSKSKRPILGEHTSWIQKILLRSMEKAFLPG